MSFYGFGADSVVFDGPADREKVYFNLMVYHGGWKLPVSNHLQTPRLTLHKICRALLKKVFFGGKGGEEATQLLLFCYKHFGPLRFSCRRYILENSKLSAFGQVSQQSPDEWLKIETSVLCTTVAAQPEHNTYMIPLVSPWKSEECNACFFTGARRIHYMHNYGKPEV